MKTLATVSLMAALSLFIQPTAFSAVSAPRITRSVIPTFASLRLSGSGAPRLPLVRRADNVSIACIDPYDIEHLERDSIKHPNDTDSAISSFACQFCGGHQAVYLGVKQYWQDPGHNAQFPDLDTHEIDYWGNKQIGLEWGCPPRNRPRP